MLSPTGLTSLPAHRVLLALPAKASRVGLLLRTPSYVVLSTTYSLAAEAARRSAAVVEDIGVWADTVGFPGPGPSQGGTCSVGQARGKRSPTAFLSGMLLIFETNPCGLSFLGTNWFIRRGGDVQAQGLQGCPATSARCIRGTRHHTLRGVRRQRFRVPCEQ